NVARYILIRLNGAQQLVSFFKIELKLAITIGLKCEFFVYFLIFLFFSFDQDRWSIWNCYCPRSLVDMDFFGHADNVRTRNAALLNLEDLLTACSIDCDFEDHTEFVGL